MLKRAKTWEVSDSEGESGCETRSMTPCGSPRKALPCVQVTRPISTGHTENRYGEPQLSQEGRSEVAELLEKLTLPSDPEHPCGSPSPGKRRRRSREELEAHRRELEEKRRAREELRQQRALQKEQKKQEQQRRKEAAERVRLYRPDNCLKCLVVSVDPALLQDEGCDTLLATLRAMELKSSIEEKTLPSSISWKMEFPLGENNLSVVEEDQVLMVLALSEFLDMVVCIQRHQEDDGEDEEPHKCLFKHLSLYLNANVEKVVTLAVIGLDCWTLQVGRHQKMKAPGHMDMEEALVFLQLYWNVACVFPGSWQDLTDHVCAITKALAKRPINQLKEEQTLPFCVDGSWASGVRVERDGRGLRQVWTRQLQQLNRVSPMVAATVSAAFPSPQLLLQAYREADSEAQRKGILTNLRIRSEQKERRIGPEISRRVYRFLTSHNPQLVLD